MKLFGLWSPRRNRFNTREYFALREAQALRLQHDKGAEAVCDARLADRAATPRDRRFYRLVRKALKRV